MAQSVYTSVFTNGMTPYEASVHHSIDIAEVYRLLKEACTAMGVRVALV